MSDRNETFAAKFFASSSVRNAFDLALGRLTRNLPASRDDIAQEARFRILRRLIRRGRPLWFDPGCPQFPVRLYNFCYRNIRWMLLAEKRRSNQNERHTAYLGPAAENICAKPCYSHQRYQSAWKRFREAFRSLPAKLRTVVRHKVRGLTIKQSARLLNVSPNWVSQLRTRASRLVSKHVLQYADT